MRKTFCILPFTHMQVKPSGQMKPCCRFEFHNQEYRTPDKNYYFDEYDMNKGVTLSQGQNSELWNGIRKKLLNNETVAGCSKCYKEENTSGFSMRTSENKLRNKDQQDGPAFDVSTPRINYIEMTFGNYCNLKCRTCNADLSSTWWEDEHALVDSGKYPDRFYYIRERTTKTINIPFNWQPEDFVHVEEIKFTGGEPMVHPDFIKLMDMLIEMDVAKNIKLDVFTNCSWIPGEKYLNRLRQFKKIVLSLSVDGVGAVNDYIRHPSKWDIVDESVTAWLELEESSRNSVHIVWNPTINIYNIMSLGNMISWWFDKNNSINANWMAQTVEINSKASEHEVVPAGKFKFNVLQDPEYLSLSLLPASMKPTIINEINQHIDNLTAINKQLTQDILMPLIKIFDNTSVSLDLQKQLKKEFKKILADTEVDQHWFTQEIKVKFQKIIKNVSQVKQSQESLDKFLMYTRDLDQLRNESFSELFPDLAEQLNKSK